MAVDDDRDDGEKKRKKMNDDRRKLLPGEKVEVLYSDEGLNGSWHVGVVMAFGEHSRLVEYTYLFSDDNSSKLKEYVPVSAAIDGRIKNPRKNHGGNIRPLPPCYQFQESEIRYGLCVDALVEDAWWEGVVFDREESSKERLVFFPDQGDQQTVDVDRLRLTQDWNEVSGDWKPRGEWLLLQVIQTFEQEDALPVSIREIWYDLRTMDAFSDKIGVWTCGSYDTWHSLLLGLIKELQAVAHGLLAPNHLLDVPMSYAAAVPMEDSPCIDDPDLLKDGAGVSSGLAAIENNFLSPSGVTLDDHSLPDSMLQGNCGKVSYLDTTTNKGTAVASEIGVCEIGVCGEKDVFLYGLKEGNTNLIWSDSNAEGSNNFAQRGDSADVMETRVSKDWTPIDLEAAYYPESIKLCVHYSEDGGQQLKDLRESNDTISNVRLKAKKHLLALGWKIEYRIREDRRSKATSDTRVRTRFVSPDGRFYHSLHTACCGLLKEYEDMHLNSRNDGGCVQQDCPVKRSKPQKENRGLAVEMLAASEDANLSSTGRGTSDFGNANEISPNVLKEHEHIDNHFISGKEKLAPNVSRTELPRAILAYKNLVDSLRRKTNKDFSQKDVMSMRLDATKHLKSTGWKFWKVKARGQILITSPSGKPFQSIYSACDEEARSRWILSSSEINKLECAHLKERRESKKRKMISHKFSSSSAAVSDRLLLKQSSARSSVCEKPIKSKARPSLSGCRRDLGSRFSSRVTRFSRRSQGTVVETPGQHAAKTVLSLLIDNDMVLPRQKVRYVRRSDGRVLMEGWITRDGIRCKCCALVYTLSNFEAHAGSSQRRPSANIFLQDGRSLLDCQMQMIHRNKPQGFQRSRVKSDYSMYTSDTICSVCHDGGSLVLCDHCPSSFHLDCVGLKDVPEGDWFCPSCRCGICGLSEFDSDSQQFTEKSVLYCDQCEREFHVGCIRKRERSRLSCCPIGNWFCSKKCSKIFLRLQKLLGKSRSTAVEGLSLTLLRSGRENGVNGQPFDAETMVEHDSKLRVALNVLHECFVTIIEPRTRSDFVADLLFNKESELRRLNFYGFYTMLLERGDEIISVATFRIYGAKVAEMPLIGTRVKYRRQGMCRLLVDGIEKLLSKLGVERLLLPAVPQLLQTWTSSFGFTKMSLSDRLDLSEYTLLNFEDTTLCQKKVLIKPKEYCEEVMGTSSKSVQKVDSEEDSIVSEVVEMMKPIQMFSSLGVEACDLPGEDALLQISYQSNADSTPSINNCVDPIDETLPETGLNDQSQLNIFPGKGCDSSVSMEIPLTAAVSNVDFKFFKRPNKHIGMSSNPQRNLFKYFYRRRISAN